MREADQFLAAEEQGEIARAAGRLNVIAAVGLVLAVTTGFFGMNILVPAWERGESVWQPVEISMFVLALLTFALLMYGCYKLTTYLQRRRR